MSEPHEKLNSVANTVFITGAVVVNAAAVASAIENLPWQAVLVVVGASMVVWGGVLSSLAKEMKGRRK